MLAYEQAEKGDFTLINELTTLFTTPYDEHSSEETDQWYRKTPLWANKLAGSHFLSCSS